VGVRVGVQGYGIPFLSLIVSAISTFGFGHLPAVDGKSYISVKIFFIHFS